MGATRFKTLRGGWSIRQQIPGIDRANGSNMVCAFAQPKQ
jgi:hypothetical protein